jgi:transposase
MSTETTTKKRRRTRPPKNKTTTGFRISDELWAVLEQLLPVRRNTHRFGGGRPRVPDRRCADAIFYGLRTGCQWDALPQTELCAKSTAHDRLPNGSLQASFCRSGRPASPRVTNCRGLTGPGCVWMGPWPKRLLGGKDGAKPHRLGQTWRKMESVDGGARCADRVGPCGRQPA